MTTKTLTLSIVATTALLSTPAFAETELDPIVVNSDFRESKLSQTSNSVTIIGEEKIYDKASQSLIDTLASTPNLNFSAGASKAKYIQIRGIGERSQFETPINPSVGMIIDNIDFSNMTLGASLFDVKQIEVLRGPQGTTFGANGMAGIITVQSNEPTKKREGHIEVTAGNYNTKAFGAAMGGTLIEDKLLGRISVYQNKSDGFMKNSYLNRKDTNNIDEVATKAQLRWLASDQHTVDLNFIHTDVDNGYDAFTFDNSRTSISDEPGKDTQKTDAVALKSTYDFNSMQLISSLSHSKTDMTYSYDEDWSNPTTAGGWVGTDEYIRDKKQTDIDIRLLSTAEKRIFNKTTDWTIGTYYKDSSDDLVRNHSWNAQYSGDYNVKSNALYGQLDTHFSDKLTLTSGLRAEKVKAKYNDSANFNISTSETLLGGKLGLSYQADENNLYYTTLSKGYKPGGVNASNAIPVNARKFETESLWNLDLGTNNSYLDNTLISRINFFYGKRRDQQVKSSFVTNPNGGGAVFNEYFANAAKGSYYGLESKLDYYVNDNLHLFTSVGLLKSKFDDYTDPNPAALNVTNRAPAQSPKYQYNIGGDIALNDAITFKANIEGRDAYYFSNRHNEKAEAYKLLHSSLEYTNDNWTASLWARNITDEDYQTRGFGTFGNNPANGYATELYTQQGTPRTFGLTVSYDY